MLISLEPVITAGFPAVITNPITTEYTINTTLKQAHHLEIYCRDLLKAL